MDGSQYTLPQGSGVSSVFNPHNHALRGVISIHVVKSRLGEINHIDRLASSHLSYVCCMGMCVPLCGHTPVYVESPEEDLECPTLSLSVEFIPVRTTHWIWS